MQFVIERSRVKDEYLHDGWTQGNIKNNLGLNLASDKEHLGELIWPVPVKNVFTNTLLFYFQFQRQGPSFPPLPPPLPHPGGHISTDQGLSCESENKQFIKKTDLNIYFQIMKKV